MALELTFGVEEYASDLQAHDGALAIVSADQGKVVLVPAARVVDAAGAGAGDGLAADAPSLEPDDCDEVRAACCLPGGRVVVADSAGALKLYADAAATTGKAFAHANAPVADLRASADGARLCACLGDRGVVVDVKTGACLTVDGGATSSSWDPTTSDRLAVLDGDAREIRLVEISLGTGVDDATVKSRCALGGAAAPATASQDALRDDEETTQLACAWQPGAGAWVAAPGRPELTLLPREPAGEDWAREAQGVFPDDDQKALFQGTVARCAWNASGSRVATVSDKGVVAVWDVSAGEAVHVFACDVAVRAAALIHWKGGEALALASGAGSLALATTLEPEEVEADDDLVDAEAAEDEAAESPKRLRKNADSQDDIEDEEDLIDAIPRRRRKKKKVVESDDDLSLSPKAENEPDADGDVVIGDAILDAPDDDPFADPGDDDVEEADAPAAPAYAPATPAQPAFMPSATPAEESGQPRYLHWSQRGCVTARPEESGLEFAFEIEHFAEGLARTRTTRFVDRRDFTVASLGKSGCVLATTPAEDDENTPSIVHFRPLDAWARDAGWAASLPPGERAEVVAAGDDFVAALTSRDLLRIYSTGGLEDAVVGSLGPTVACAAHGRRLAVAYHQGPPHDDRQRLCVQVLDVEARKAQNGAGTPLPLPAGITLTWLAFKADDGVLMAGDSAGTFWMLVDDFGWRFSPALDAPAARANPTDREWPVFARHGAIHCAVLKGGLRHPPCRGARPVLDALPLRLPHASAAHDAKARQAEAGLGAPTALARQRARLAGAPRILGALRRPTPDDLERDDAQIGALRRAAGDAVLQRDRAVLRQLVAATKDARYARAYDLARRLQLEDSLRLAAKIAASHGEDALTARVEDLVAAAAEVAPPPAAPYEAPPEPAAPPAPVAAENVPPRAPAAAKPVEAPPAPAEAFDATSFNPFKVKN